MQPCFPECWLGCHLEIWSRRWPILPKLWSRPSVWWLPPAKDDRRVVSEPCWIVRGGSRWRLQELLHLQLLLGVYPPVLPRWHGLPVHSWSVGRCLDSEIRGSLGVWPWFHLIVQLNRPMLLLLLLPEKWLRFERRTDCCPETPVPERKIKLRWPMETKDWWNRPTERKVVYLFQAYFF